MSPIPKPPIQDPDPGTPGIPQDPPIDLPLDPPIQEPQDSQAHHRVAVHGQAAAVERSRLRNHLGWAADIPAGKPVGELAGHVGVLLQVGFRRLDR